MTINRNLSILASGVSSTGVLGVPNGGSGATTLTGYLIGNGTGAFTASATIPTTALSGTITNAQLTNSAITINGTSTSLGGSISVGTVTSVAASVPTFLSITGSPITSTGTLAISYSGTALPIANGGTAQTSFTAGNIHFGSFSTSSNLFWDNTNSRLSLQKGASPSYNIDILSATPTIRLATPSAAADNATILFEIANNFSGISQAYIKGIGPGNSGVSQLAFGVAITSGATTATEVARFDTGGNFRPSADNAYSNGTAALRWSVIYSATALINTSDATQKQQVRGLNNAEKQAALGIKQALKAFKFNDSVAEKGDKARIHIGVLAQEVREIFSVVGLDANDYGLFCSDTWYVNDKQEVFKTNLDVDGKAINTLTPVTRLGVRYEELLAFVIAAL